MIEWIILAGIFWVIGEVLLFIYGTRGNEMDYVWFVIINIVIMAGSGLLTLYTKELYQDFSFNVTVFINILIGASMIGGLLLFKWILYKIYMMSGDKKE